MVAKDASRSDLKDLLLREGVITLPMLNELLTEQEKTKESLLEVLLRKDAFDSKKLLQVFTSHYGFTSVNPSVFVIEEHVVVLLSKEVAEKYLVLPISVLDHTLTVAFANPTNIRAIDEIQAITGMRVKAVAADVKILKKSIAKVYDQKIEITDGGVDRDAKEDNFDELVKMIEGEQDQDVTGKDELLKVAFETPVIKLVNNLLLEGIRRHASDIFVEPWESYVRVRARVDGLLEELIRPPKAMGEALVSRIKVMSNLDIAEHRVPQDGRFKVRMKERAVDMRVSVLPTNFGEKVCMRILDTSSQGHDISKLGFNHREQTIIKDCARKPHGMILVTGPTGSGKTTTLYSVLKYLHSPDVNITTVEDPVEYQMPGINQVSVRDQIGLSFPAALRSILRQDPDIILIGEIRDSDTLDIAVKAALTGHLVLSTLHTNDAISSVIRMANMGLEPFLISSTVLMISAQRLVRCVCTKCKTEDSIDPESLKQLGLEGKNLKFYKGRGCGQCRKTGYSGRSVITEIAQITPALRQAIMKNLPAEQLKLLAHDEGMTTLRECALRKALMGETTLEEVFRVTTADQGIPLKIDLENAEVKAA